MLSRGKTEKLDSRTEVCLFIGYPKGTRGGIFYNPKDKKVFVSTHVLLEENSEKTTPDNSTRVVEKGTDFVTINIVDIDNEINKYYRSEGYNT